MVEISAVFVGIVGCVVSVGMVGVVIPTNARVAVSSTPVAGIPRAVWNF